MKERPALARSPTQGKAQLRLRRALNIGGYLGFALSVALLGLLLAAAVPKFLGFDSFVIYSGSMEPTVKVGSLLVAKVVPAGDLQVGDIVVFRYPESPNSTITHRIVAIREENGERVFATKGDASSNPDPREVRLRGQVGRMVYDIPYLGYLVDFSRSTKGILVLLVLPAAGLVGLHALTLRKMRRGRGSEEMAAPAAPTLAAAEGEVAPRRRPSRKAASAAARGHSHPERVISGGSR